jgi:hypothetical protein
VQFLTGANATSGSAKLIFYTASSSPWNADTLVLTGTLVVDGNISASSYTIKNITEVDGSGSTWFGDSTADQHVRTGSLKMWNGNTTYGTQPYFQTHTDINSTGPGLTIISSSFRIHYSASVLTAFTLKGNEHLVGIRAAGNVTVTIPQANNWTSNKRLGTQLIFKDEVQYRTGSITIATVGSSTIDGEATYELSGTMPAINMYTNGANWFVY